VRPRSFSLVVSIYTLTRAFRENWLTYHGQLLGSSCGGGDVVGIAHSQESIHRAVLILADRVDNGVPKVTSVACVSEKGAGNPKRQYWERKFAAYRMAASKSGKMACSEAILGSANSSTAGCTSGAGGVAGLCCCVSDGGCAAGGGVVAVTVSLALSTSSCATSGSAVGDWMGGGECGCGSSSRL